MLLPGEKAALVTGAGRGIGRAVALALAQAGWALCLAARSREELEETRQLSKLAPARSLIVLVDLADTEAPDHLFETAVSHFGRLDLLVNNAGWAPPRTALVKLRPDDIDRMLMVNLRAPIALARLAAARMATQDGGGVIVNIASAAAHRPAAGESVYAAVKAGLVAFTRSCFAEMRSTGVRTAVIVPGLTDTTFIPSNKRLVRDLMLRAEDVAGAVMGVVNAAAGACPLEIVLEPARDPMRAG